MRAWYKGYVTLKAVTMFMTGHNPSEILVEITQHKMLQKYVCTYLSVQRRSGYL